MKRSDAAPPPQWSTGVGFRVLGPGTGELVLAAGARTPAFRHSREVRRFRVRAGTVTAWRGEEAEVLGRGASLVVPAGAAVVLEGGPAVVRLTLTPPGAEATLAAIAVAAGEPAPDPDDVAALLTAAGIALARR